MWANSVAQAYHEQDLLLEATLASISGCEVIKNMATTSEAAPCKTSELLSTTNNTNTCAILNSNTEFNCTNCDIKFDSESSLRVHLQVRIWSKFANYLFDREQPQITPSIEQRSLRASASQHRLPFPNSTVWTTTLSSKRTAVETTETALSTTKWSMLVLLN